MNNGILVLGAGGFIGQHLVRQLVSKGLRVFAMGHAMPTADNGQLTRIRGTAEDTSLVRELLTHCSSVVYLASLTTPSSSAREPSLEVTGNLLPLSRLLECASDFPGRRLIYLSSAGAVYGDLAHDASETTVLRPRSYYGAGKAAAEAFIHSCTASSDWEAVILRPSNIYGPGQAVSKGFAIVPTLFSRAVDGVTFQIWGDGKTVRDYCFITDLVEATTKVLLEPTPTRFAVYNLASGYASTVLDLVAACESASGREIRVQLFPPRGVDVRHVSPRRDSLRQAYGWQATVGLSEGLKQTWEWFHQQLESGQYR